MNPQFGTNANAVRKKRVYFTGSTIIYRGMPVCYDDSTTNVLGIDTYDDSVSTTTTAGYLNEGHFLRVERPASDNLMRFAGVVAGSSEAGKTGPKWLDIYVPNGAVVPVRVDVACTDGTTILAMADGEEELGVPSSGTRPVAIARETLSSTTARVILAELCPNKFMYQHAQGTDLDMAAGTHYGELRVGTTATSIVTGPQFRVTHTGTGAGGIIGTLIRTTECGTAIAGLTCALWTQLTLGASSVITSGYRGCGLFAKTHVLSTAGTHAGDIYAAHFCLGLDKAVTGKTAQMYFESTTIVGEHVDYWFVTRGGSPGEDIGFAVDSTGTNQIGSIKIRLGYAADDGYIPVYDQSAVP